MSFPVDLSSLRGCQGTEREAALGTLEKQLICPICLQIFNKPVVILPCQHNLCRKCANELYQPSLYQAWTTMSVNSGRFRCPSCRQEVVLDRHGVYGLPRNLLVENIIDVYKQEVSNSTAPSPLPPPMSQGKVTCADHEDEKVNIYCLSCQIPTCSLCKVFGAHKNCQVSPLADIYQQQKAELNDGVCSLSGFSDKVQTFINELEETCRNIEENSKTQKQTLCYKFDRMFSILEERLQAMTHQISSEQEEKTGHAQSLVRSYGDRVETNTKLVEIALSSMEDPDVAMFVQNSRELIAKVVEATSCCPVETLEPGYEDMNQYRFNFSGQERALHSIDFIKAEEVSEEPEKQLEQSPEEPQPEEPKHHPEPSVQNLNPKHSSEPTIQTLDPILQLGLEPVQDQIPTSIIPVVLTAVPVASIVSPMPSPVEDSGPVLDTKTEGPVLNDQVDGLLMTKKEDEKEEEKQVAEVRGEAKGCAVSDPIKEGSLCEDQGGMNTQQAVTLLFYLLAFLVILQRVWAYIGCFICT
ncbi:tripartite motif containing 101 [Lampris incognitus]|uniref:tripartite motif containing 101 n=1 Tax=Lampris incognitus TaxID=2546036 RepID=UPI0024B4FAD6|nr:tripartite motif containing 101 [Lampris incognitus]